MIFVPTRIDDDRPGPPPRPGPGLATRSAGAASESSRRPGRSPASRRDTETEGRVFLGRRLREAFLRVSTSGRKCGRAVRDSDGLGGRTAGRNRRVRVCLCLCLCLSTSLASLRQIPLISIPAISATFKSGPLSGARLVAMELNGSQAIPSDRNRPSQDRRQSRPAPVADGVQPWLKEELAESKKKRKAYLHLTTMKKA
jgi:hypothetical protein